MRAWYLQPGTPNLGLELRETALPEPGPQQMLVRIRAAGLNRGELNPPLASAKPAGMEGAGEVEKLGAGVTRFKVGDRVMARCPGSFAEYALMDARETMAVPARLSWVDAAAIPIAFLVVYDMLVAQGRLAEGEWLLVTGITSGVGVYALQAAKALGAKVIGTSGSAQKLEKLKPLGLDVALVTRRPDFAAAVARATDDRGAQLCVNTVGGTMFGECVRALGFEGRLAIVGYVDGSLKAEMDLDALHGKRLTLFGVSNTLRNAEQRARTVRGFERDFLPLLADGRLRPLIDGAYTFAELPAAKARMEANEHVGKLVLTL
jgi:NADPH:quinone reductase-like Zn-dependent oxidoreductase